MTGPVIPPRKLSESPYRLTEGAVPKSHRTVEAVPPGKRAAISTGRSNYLRVEPGSATRPRIARRGSNTSTAHSYAASCQEPKHT